MRLCVCVTVLLIGGVASARQVMVTTAAELTAAIGAAQAGDEIVLQPGDYPLTGADCSAVGTAAAPIVVRAATPLSAHIQMNALEGFKVAGAYWRFEGLDVRGVCPNDADCEHAFHVFGAAHGFVLRSSRVFDFNAQLKVNAIPPVSPNGGLVEGNELGDSHARNTTTPVTKLNLDSGDDWIVRANYIHDAHKTNTDPTYAAFMKSGGHNGLFERNLVICSKDFTDATTQVGLSFGGGGTAPQFCQPAFDANVPCAVEHSNGTMRNNIIVNCSDVGIYLNRADRSHILHNTLIATNGIDFRFSTTSGEATGNLLASMIRARDSATFTAADNLTGITAAQFAAWYQNPLAGDLRRAGDLSTVLQKAARTPLVPDDYCARLRGDPAYDVGALESTLGDCVTVPPPLGAAGSADGGAPLDAAVGGDGAGALDGGSIGIGLDRKGCGCRVGGAPSPRLPSLPLLAVALSAAGILRRSRRSPS